MARPYCPKRGDVVWLTFHPKAGHEQTGRRPALVLSPESYNRKTGLAVLCPITSQIKGYPFEVILPEDLRASGVVLSDQVKKLNWRAREAAFFCRTTEETLQEVLAKLLTVLGL